MAKIVTTLGDVLSYLGSKNYRFIDTFKFKITGVNSISIASRGDMTFCSYQDEKGLNLIKTTKATLIICHENLKDHTAKIDANFIFVDRPRLWFLRCMRRFLDNERLKGIHDTAIVETNEVGKNVYIGPYSYIQQEVTIGDNTIIHNNVSIYGKTRIGNDVVIDVGSVIGTDGFGFERSESDKLEFFPQLGGIIIQDQVEIGSNVCIDKGTFDDTIIGRGTKIDNLVHVAHNVKIGKNCMIVAKVLLGGSSIIEDSVHIAMSATIRDGIRVGQNSIVGMGAVVTRNVPENLTVIGIPAKPIKSSNV